MDYPRLPKVEAPQIVPLSTYTYEAAQSQSHDMALLSNRFPGTQRRTQPCRPPPNLSRSRRPNTDSSY
jgi:hypothetical protein